MTNTFDPRVYQTFSNSRNNIKLCQLLSLCGQSLNPFSSRWRFQNSRIAKTCQYFGRFDHDHSPSFCKKILKILPQYVKSTSVPKSWYGGRGVKPILAMSDFENTYSNHPSLTIKKNFSFLLIYGVFLYVSSPSSAAKTKTSKELFYINNFLNKWLSLTATYFSFWC